jgi:flavin-dependent dehydrogenase
MKIKGHYDVVIAGGGLAGLCLALQLKQRMTSIDILVAEKLTLPNQEAAHKVGESSVEAASHYFQDVLDIGDLLAQELPKFGLRFFMSNGDNSDIASRVECGPSHYLHFPSYQIDRGRFENGLARRVREAGVDLLDGCRVGNIRLRNEGHAVSLRTSSKSEDVSCRWFIDATGRASLLKKNLGLEHSNQHNVNAAWFRIDHAIDPDDWSSDPEWRGRLKESRRLSTNHFMGPGYWVWLIPLANNRTSVGIVADEGMHHFEEICSFPKALKWLDAHEPQCASVVRAHLDHRMDFRALKDYSHDVKRVYNSSDRWCLIGDAGNFVDPLYSPGSDFIGITNGFACDLISRDLGGEAIHALTEVYDQSFRSLSRTYLATYQRQYPLMGYARIMTAKIVWDFVMYWGGVALLFRCSKLCDTAFMERVNPLLQEFAYTNIGMQAFFRKWARASEDADPQLASFVDYSEIEFLAELNRRLTMEHEDEAVVAQLSRNLELANELKLEITAEALLTSKLVLRNEVPPSTGHLTAMFETLRGRPTTVEA